MDYDLQILEDGLKHWDLELSELQKSQFVRFYEYLVEKNKVMNLTGITDFEEVLIKHFLDSIACAQVLDIRQIDTVIDVGTGAGFPGIPLKIMFPNLKYDLLDTLKKRIRFLNETIDLLGLDEIHAFHGRAEEFARKKEHRGVYDLCVSRAVSNLATLSEYCLPFVKCGGKFVSYKSGSVQEEIDQASNAIRILGGKIKEIKFFRLPNTDIDRSLIVIEKVKETPAKYPRKAGTPQKEPL